MDRVRRLTGSLAAVLAAVLFALVVLPGAARATEVVHACDLGTSANNVWGPFDGASGACYLNGNLFVSSAVTVNPPTGTGPGFTATAPAGLEIVGTQFTPQTPDETPPTSTSSGEWMSYYVWSGGAFERYVVGGGACVIRPGGLGCGNAGTPIPASFASPSFTIQLRCSGSPTCTDAASLQQPAPDLVVGETAQPSASVAAGTLAAAIGWIRGSWPLNVTGSAASGVCSMSASLGGLGIGSTSSAQDDTQWKQCSAPPVTGTVDTTKFANGAEPFVATAHSAAGNTASLNRTLDIDNVTPTVALSGRPDVPAGSGPARMTATASAGPSGVSAITCNVDGATETFPISGAPNTASATINLSGIGVHAVSCLASNAAQDAQGQAASSALTSRSMMIRTPTAALASFAKLVDKRLCHTVRKRVRVPAGWRTIRWHGHKVRARLPAHMVRKKVRVCHERLKRRRIVVYRTVRRHHHKVRVKRHKRVRVPVAPHLIHKGIRTVRFGHRTHLSGLLVTTTGQALGGVTVTIMGANRNGNGRFRPLTSTTTNQDGVWHARIPRGPGRILEAVYGGSQTTEPAISDQVRTIVHARVRLNRIKPRAVPWHGRITLSGRLPGGHLPHRGINLRLEYGVGHHSTTYAVRQHVGARRHKRFRAHFTFGAGPARAHATFFFRVCTLPSPRYPFAPGCSGKRTVHVGGHPNVARELRRARHRHRHHHRHHHRRDRPS